MMKEDVTTSERGEKCLEWLKDSELMHASRRSRKYAGTELWLRMEKGKEHVTMFVSKGFTEGNFTAVTNRPGTNVPACDLGGFDIKARNVPDAARKMVSFAGIDNPKNVKI